MNRIRGPIAYPKKVVRQTPPVAGVTGRGADVDEAIVRRVPTGVIIATMGVTNAMIQSRKRKLRNMGKL